jgi:hypothetical protein
MDLFAAAAVAAPVSLLTTALVLGLRHGIDWDHIAAITDITSTTAAADVAETGHELEHASIPGHDHAHGGPAELAAHGRRGDGAGPGAMAARPLGAEVTRARLWTEQRHAIALGTLYALGHAVVVAALGFLALQFGAILPDWVDPLMGRVVGLTLVVLGIWVFISLYHYARHGGEFRLRSRWMLVFDSARYAWRRFQAAIHGHEHVRPLEMSAYGARTAFLVGMIHGVGAETGTQVLIIAAIGGAAGLGLGVPMMLAFIAGLLISNTAIVIISSAGFVTSQLRQRVYLVVGALAAVFSLVVGLLFLFEAESLLPTLDPLAFLGGD